VDLAGIITRLRETGAELEDVEVKRASGGVPESLPSTLSAFANSRGGVIILGLDEQSGFAAVGVADAPAMRDAVAGLARERLTPALSPSIEIAGFEGARLVVAEVEALPLAQRPCYVTARGLYGGSYVRVGDGDGDQRMTPYEIDRLRENAGQPRWDEEPVVQASEADLHPGMLQRIIEAARSRSPRAFAGIDDRETLTRLGVLVRHDEALVPSLAGLLTAGRYPQQFFPQLMVSVAVYPHRDPRRPGPGGLRFVDSATLGGPVPDMVADAIQAVQRNMRVASRITGPGREDRWEVEPEVIREAIVNALMHRDYSPQARGTQVQIEVYPDRMTVTSPGGLFGNVRLETLGQSGTSSSRNARLAALLQEAGDSVTGRPVAENRGSGVRMMIDRVRDDTGIVPLFAANLDQFRVTIPRTSPVTPEFILWAARVSGADLSGAQLAALALAREGYDVDLPLLRRLGLDSGQSRRELGELVESGLLRSRKARDDGPYRLAPQLLDTGTGGADPLTPLGNDLAAQVIAVLRDADDASREELQKVTDATRSTLTNVLQDLVDEGVLEATAPTRSPNRRYRLAARLKR
jgi:ATP-dependent DNA helicase RecG